MFLTVVSFGGGGLVIGSVLSRFLRRLYVRRLHSMAQTEAEELIAEIKAEGDSLMAEAKARETRVASTN